MTVSDRFVLFMREQGLNQKDLAERINYPRTNLSNFVNGNVKSPKIDLLVALASEYPQLNINWLLLGEGNMWNNDYVKSGKKKSEVIAPVDDGIEVLGTGTGTKVLQDLFDTKDKLLDIQQKHIEQLEEEIKRLKTKLKGEEK